MNAEVSLSRSSSSSFASAGLSAASPALGAEPNAPTTNVSETPIVLYDEHLPVPTAADVGLEVEAGHAAVDSDETPDIASIIEIPTRSTTAGPSSDVATDGDSQVGTWDHAQSHGADSGVSREPCSAPSSSTSSA